MATTQVARDPARTFLFAAGLTFAGIVFLNASRSGSGGGELPDDAVTEDQKRPSVNDVEADDVGRYLTGLFTGTGADAKTLPESFATVPGGVYIAARGNGDRLYWVWRNGKTTTEALDSAMTALAKGLGDDKKSRVTTLEVNVAHNFRSIDPVRDRKKTANILRGIRGVELLWGKEAQRFAPTEMLAMNIDFEKAYDRFAEKHKLSKSDIDGQTVRVRVFDADTLLVDLVKGDTTRMVRGNELIPIESVTKDSVVVLRDALANWLFNNLQPNGRMVYKYWPSRGEESGGNNMIRQWMATTAMGRVAASRGNDPVLYGRVADNIRYNLSQFYQQDGKFGLIDEMGKVKLGAMALAALSILEHPNRVEWDRYERGLQTTIDALHQESGRFYTFYRPSGRVDNENFYPGEALLYWASLYKESKDPVMLEKIMRTKRFYKQWHLDNRNPAFIPWHTQAYFLVWQLADADTRKELQEWVFEMNDWLIPVQQWDDLKDYPDAQGRFHDPKRPFGPPHASSTGVYLEGLIDAWRMATELGDTARAETYRRTIMRGLRSTMQLTFFDDVDMYYVSQKDKVRGGVRTTEYDNEIRVDNIQHCLMGILRILEFMPPEAFRP